MMVKTIDELLIDRAKRCNFDKPLGVMAKSIAVRELSNYFTHPKLKNELSNCTNLTQMRNVINQFTIELHSPRSESEIKKFSEKFERLLKISGL